MQRVPSFLRWLAGGLAGVVVLTGLFVAKGQGQREALPIEVTASASAEAKAKILRLLIIICDDQGATTGATILSRSSNSQTIRLFNVDPQVAVDLGAQGIRALSETGQDTVIDAIQHGVQVATGIPIDATLRMQRLPLAGLIDSVGGIEITSAQGFLVSGEDETPLYVPEGTNFVTGAQAADFATFTVAGAPEADRIARMNQVLTAIFKTLPVDEKRLTEIVESLGAMAGTNVPTADVVSMLIDLSESNAWDFPIARTLPSVASDLEQMVASTWQRIELAQTAPIGKSLEKSEFTIQLARPAVLVRGGLAQDRITLRNQLINNGFDFIDGGNPGLETSTQFTASNSLPQKEIAAILSALGMDPLWSSRVNQSEDSIADLIVTLGADFILTTSN